MEKPYIIHVGSHKRIHNTGRPYTAEDYTITKFFQEQVRISFVLAIYSGLRKEELLALQWDDINFVSDIVQVSKAETIVEG